MNTFICSVILSGDMSAIEQNIDMIVEAIDPIILDGCEIVIRNESELADDE